MGEATAFRLDDILHNVLQISGFFYFKPSDYRKYIRKFADNNYNNLHVIVNKSYSSVFSALSFIIKRSSSCEELKSNNLSATFSNSAALCHITQ